MGFIFNQNAGETPETIAQKRKIADALASQAVSQAPMRSWTQGLSQIVAALGSKYQSSKADKAEAVGRDSATSGFNGIMSSLFPDNAAATGAAPSAPPPGDMSKGAKIASMLQSDFGLSPAAAAGFAGNLAHESGNFSTLQEIKPTVPGSKGGYGWAQWTGPRRRAFEQFAAQNKLDPTSDEANYGFLKYELQNTPEGAVLAKLKGVNDPAQAAQIVAQYYERPGVPHMNSRINYATQIAGMGGAGGGSAPVVPAPRNASGGATVQPAGYSPAAAQQAGQMPMGKIFELMSNPYLSEAQQGILANIIKQKMATGEWTKLNDGTMFNNLTGETQKVEVPRGPMAVSQGQTIFDPNTQQPMFSIPAKPEAPLSVSPGETLLDPVTKKPIFSVPAAAEKPPSSVQEYEYAKTQGFKGSFEQWKAREQNGGPKLNDVSGIRKEVQDTPQVKTYAQAAPIYRSMVETAGRDTRASDLNLVYGIGKLFDPGSVVREGEMVMVKNAAALPSRIQEIISLFNGSSGLTPELRAEIMNEAKSRMDSYKSEVEALRPQYEGIASRNNINMDDIWQPFPVLPDYTPPPPSNDWVDVGNGVRVRRKPK